MTEYERWLADEEVPLGNGPFHRGYSWLGIDHGRAMREGADAATLLARMRPARNEAINRFSFAIPNAEALAAIAAGGPVLEVGAGTGYWTYELRKLGVDVVACDPDPYHDNNAKPARAWTDVLPITALDATDRHGAGRNLLLVWPSYDAPWAADVLLSRPWPRVYYVGEWGGCTADDRFHDLLTERWDVEQEVDVPVWEGMHDRLHVCKLKEPV